MCFDFLIRFTELVGPRLYDFLIGFIWLDHCDFFGLGWVDEAGKVWVLREGGQWAAGAAEKGAASHGSVALGRAALGAFDDKWRHVGTGFFLASKGQGAIGLMTLARRASAPAFLGQRRLLFLFLLRLPVVRRPSSPKRHLLPFFQTWAKIWATGALAGI